MKITAPKIAEIEGGEFEYNHTFENAEYIYYYKLDVGGKILDNRTVKKDVIDPIKKYGKEFRGIDL